MNHLPQAATPIRLPVQFVGTGREYFGIWVVNVVLTLATLGLFYPFARARRLQYFCNAIRVGGHPLSFRGDPWRMLPGHALALLIAFSSGAAEGVELALAVLFVAVAAAPALWHAALRERVDGMGWQGLQFRFHGSVGGAYAACGVGLVLAALSLGLAAWDLSAGSGSPLSPTGLSHAAKPWLWGVAALTCPAWLWRLRLYRHAHYGLADERTRFGAAIGPFYGIAARSALLATAGFIVAALPLMGLVWLAERAAGGVPGGLLLLGIVMQLLQQGPHYSIGLLTLSMLLPVLWLWLGAACASRPYTTSRMQNLAWNSTRSQHLRIESRLAAGPLFELALRNGVLMACTLGLYWPFAAVDRARLRLQAMTVLSTLTPEALASMAVPDASTPRRSAARRRPEASLT